MSLHRACCPCQAEGNPYCETCDNLTYTVSLAGSTTMYADCNAGVSGPWSYGGVITYQFPSTLVLTAKEDSFPGACFWEGCSRWSTVATLGPQDMTFCTPSDYPDYCPNPPTGISAWTMRARLCGDLQVLNGIGPYRVELWVEMETSLAGSGVWYGCSSSHFPVAVYHFDYDGLFCPTKGSSFYLFGGSDNTDYVACWWEYQLQTCVDEGGHEGTYGIYGPTWRFSAADSWSATISLT